MALADSQRQALIDERGEPLLRIEFDVFADGQVSMWTHFKHGDDFRRVKAELEAARAHLTEFLKDESMCPFRHAEKPQIQVGNIELDKRLDRGKTIAVIYRHATYGELDYRALAREQIMTAARNGSWSIAAMKSHSVELDFHCHIILIDEIAQDDQSRGCRFDRVYVMPPAELIGDGIRHALVPR